MPSVYINEKNYMAAYQEAFDENQKIQDPQHTITVKDVINRILEDHFKVKKT